MKISQTLRWRRNPAKLLGLWWKYPSPRPAPHLLSIDSTHRCKKLFPISRDAEKVSLDKERERKRMKERRDKQTEEEKQQERNISKATMKKCRAKMNKDRIQASTMKRRKIRKESGK